MAAKDICVSFNKAQTVIGADMQKSITFILPSVVQKRGAYSKHSLPSSAKLSLPSTHPVWLASLAENRRSEKAVSKIDWLGT